MVRRFGRPGALAFAAALMCCTTSSAQDTIRLGGKYSSDTIGTASNLRDAGATLQRLDLRPNANDEIEPVHYRYGWRGYGYGWGGYRGWGGYHGFYGGYAGYYRPSFSVNFGYYPRYYGYYPRYYSYPVYSYSYPVYSYYSYPSYYGCYSPIGGTIGTQATIITLNAQPQAQRDVMPPAREFVPDNPMPIPQRQKAAPADGTFPYDGGPAKPVPMPRPDGGVAPPSKDAPPVPMPNERMVSIPAKKPLSYPAYGDDKRQPAKASDGITFVKAVRTP